MLLRDRIRLGAVLTVFLLLYPLFFLRLFTWQAGDPWYGFTDFILPFLAMLNLPGVIQPFLRFLARFRPFLVLCSFTAPLFAFYATLSFFPFRTTQVVFISLYAVLLICLVLFFRTLSRKSPIIFLLLFLVTNGVRSIQELLYSGVPEKALLPPHWIFYLEGIAVILTTVGGSFFLYYEREALIDI